METVSLGTTTSPSPVQSTTPSASSSLTEQQRQHLREQEKIEFYRTYDVMTGVRIAATLGGFFGLMVILVLYKSKSKTEKVLTDPKLAAAVVEAEEERQLNAALEATAEYACLNPRGARRSLGNTSAPIIRYTRFSSIGDPSSLLEPPGRPQHRFLLDVPDGNISRRPSNTTTCSSSDSSYLERRNSSVLGMPPLPLQRGTHSRRRQSSPVPWDMYYPIDIRVIQPTPGGSPCGSERALHAGAASGLGASTAGNGAHKKLAPLASISSCASSLAVDYPDLDIRSLGSDSVFLDDEECIDTEDEVTQFSTDSDEDSEVTLPGPTLMQMSDRGSLIYLKPSSSVDLEDGSWSQETLF